MRAFDDPLGKQWARSLGTARRLRNVEQKVLARKLGISPRTLCAYELGRRYANYTMLVRWARALRKMAA